MRALRSWICLWQSSKQASRLAFSDWKAFTIISMMVCMVGSAAGTDIGLEGGLLGVSSTSLSFKGSWLSPCCPCSSSFDRLDGAGLDAWGRGAALLTMSAIDQVKIFQSIDSRRVLGRFRSDHDGSM